MQVLSEAFETMMIEAVMKQVDQAVRDIERKYAVRSQYFNKKNACIYADISAPTLDSWIAMGLSISKINGSYCINRDDLDRFIQKYKM